LDTKWISFGVSEGAQREKETDENKQIKKNRKAKKKTKK